MKVSYSLHFIFSILESCSATIKSKSGRSQLREKSKNELQIKQVSHNHIKKKVLIIILEIGTMFLSLTITLNPSS